VFQLPAPVAVLAKTFERPVLQKSMVDEKD